MPAPVAEFVGVSIGDGPALTRFFRAENGRLSMLRSSLVSAQYIVPKSGATRQTGLPGDTKRFALTIPGPYGSSRSFEMEVSAYNPAAKYESQF